MKKVLTIAGSDCSGGAGIQADIKTITVHGRYAMSVITALTAQNTTGVTGISPVEPDFIAKQIDAVFSDIRPDAVKIGMLPGSEAIRTVAERLRFWKAEKIVVDPVMVATSGDRLLPAEGLDAMIRELFPIAALITPNIPEAEVLCGFSIQNTKDMHKAAKQIAQSVSCGILIKGGHLSDAPADLYYCSGVSSWYAARRIDNSNTHGTGCTLSSAIACRMAEGHSVEDSISLAKRYLTGAISAGLDLGAGRGPLNHGYRLFKEVRP